MPLHPWLPMPYIPYPLSPWANRVDGGHKRLLSFDAIFRKYHIWDESRGMIGIPNIFQFRDIGHSTQPYIRHILWKSFPWWSDCLGVGGIRAYLQKILASLFLCHFISRKEFKICFWKKSFLAVCTPKNWRKGTEELKLAIFKIF